MSTIPNKKRIAIIGGGTNTYISNHLALSAPAYGSTAKRLLNNFRRHEQNKMEVDLYLTKMAGPHTNPFNQDRPDTPEEVEALVDKLIADPDTRVIIFNVAMVDFKPTYLTEWRREDRTLGEDVNTFGKYNRRISTAGTPVIDLELKPQDKIIQKIRKERKDILLVGFKTTCGATKEEQFNKGLKLCKDASANIVFVNDVDKDRIASLTKCLYDLNLLKELNKDTDCSSNILEKEILALQNNGLVTPEESSYWYNTRDEALDALVQMVLDRSHLHFTRSTVVDSETVPWNTQVFSPAHSYQAILHEGTPYARTATFHTRDEYVLGPNPLIPETFRTVFDWVRSQGAYKQGPTGATVGHFGIKLGPNEFLTSKRKTDFNKIEEVGLVRVITDDPDDVFGYKHFFETEEETKLKKLIDTCRTSFALGELSLEERNDIERTLMETKQKLDCIKLKITPTIQRLEKQLNDIKDPLKLKEAIRFIEKSKKDYRSTLKKDDKVIAFGAKPSVGGQSQRSLFETFPDLDCIVHFHCPLKTEHREEFNTTPQFSFECGSQECIASNITGFKEYKVSDTYSIWAGHMDYHGPNIVFNKDIDPQLVIDFINKYWDLSRKTDGLTKENK